MATTTAPPDLDPPRTGKMSRTVISISIALLLVLGGSSAWALDRFVIDHVEIADVAAYEAAMSAATADTATVEVAVSDETATSEVASSDIADQSTESVTATVTDNSYVSDDATITVTEVTTGSGQNAVTYYVADVVVSDATVVRSAFANNQFGTNIVQDTSVIAEANDAILAINGDYYGFRDSGIVIRNGVVYRDEGARMGLAFYLDGTMAVYDETQTNAEELLADGVWNTLSFGPALLADGQIIDGIEDIEVDTNFGNHSIQGTQPRTGIGIIDANHYVFVVVDGRSPGYSRGVTMTEFAQIFQDLGATVAYNLDGGGSATMYFNGEVVNNPLGRGHERGVSDIIYIAEASS